MEHFMQAIEKNPGFRKELEIPTLSVIVLEVDLQAPD